MLPDLGVMDNFQCSFSYTSTDWPVTCSLAMPFRSSSVVLKTPLSKVVGFISIPEKGMSAICVSSFPEVSFRPSPLNDHSEELSFHCSRVTETGEVPDLLSILVFPTFISP